MASSFPHLRALCSRALHMQSSPTTLPSAISLLKSQPSHYVIASLHKTRYLLTPKDLLTIPRLRNVSVGDVLRLSKIHELGSRDYTLRGEPFVPPDAINVHATVVEHTKGRMEEIFKKKRRKGYQKHIRHKQGYTRLRIGPIDIIDPVLLPQKQSMSMSD